MNLKPSLLETIKMKAQFSVERTNKQNTKVYIPFLIDTEDNTLYIDVCSCILLIWPQQYRLSPRTKLKDCDNVKKRFDKLGVKHMSFTPRTYELQIYVPTDHLPEVLQSICHQSKEAHDICERFIENEIHEIREIATEKIPTALEEQKQDEIEKYKKTSRTYLTQIREQQTIFESIVNGFKPRFDLPDIDLSALTIALDKIESGL